MITHYEEERIEQNQDVMSSDGLRAIISSKEQSAKELRLSLCAHCIAAAAADVSAIVVVVL